MAQTLCFLFSDVEGSTRLLSALGAERYGAVLARYRSALERAAADEGGRVVDQEGDGLFLVFPTAAAALRAALAGQRALAADGWPHDERVRVRMGIHAGEVERQADGYIGLAVHRAARIASAAHGGQVLVSEAASVLSADDLPDGLALRDLGEHRLQDLQRRERLYQLSGAELATDFPPLQTLDAAPNNLPLQPTSFVGRQGELAEIGRLLEQRGLLTLTGVGGAGKSRLALQAAAAALERYPDGVWLVELAPLTQADAVTGAVAGALGMREDARGVAQGTALEDQLLEHLRPRRLLLILDNCEHLLDEASRLVDMLLRSCPQVRMLATSREALGVPGETIWRVPSLSVPADAGGSSDAVQLFAERARAVLPSFLLSAATLPAVVQICRRLDGIPLAIELAAARIRFLSVDQLAARLDDRFRLLTGGSRTALPRQQTLEAAIDWSYRLLSEPEQELFTRLSVFTGGFTLETAEEVAAGGILSQSNIMELVFHLADKSLVTPLEERRGPVRYRLLETLRQYGLTKLAESGDAEAVRDRHRDRFAVLARQARVQLPATTRRAWLEDVGRELDNLRGALEWAAATNRDQDASLLAAALAWHAMTQGQYRRAIDHWRTALAQATRGAEKPWEVELHYHLAGVLPMVGDQDGGLQEIERARDLLTHGGTPATSARVLARYASLVRGHVARSASEALEPARQAVSQAREVGDPALLSYALGTLGSTFAWLGDIDAGAAQLREALALARDADDREAMAAIYSALFVTLHDFGHREPESERLAAEMRSWLESMTQRPSWTFDISGQICYFHLRRGEWTQVEELLAEIAERYHLEGFDRAWLLQVRGALRWMQGRLAEARADAEELRGLRIARWNHDLYPLLAEIAAAEGRLEDVRATAAAYLSERVDPTEEVMKVAVLSPLVRAEVDAALAAPGDEQAQHTERAYAAASQAELLVERFPPAAAGAIQFEAAPAQLLLVRAELSRLAGPQPDLWLRLTSEAWYAYTRLYAGWRLAEARFARGEPDEGREQLGLAHREAERRGARLIASECRALAGRTDTALEPPPEQPVRADV